MGERSEEETGQHDNQEAPPKDNPRFLVGMLFPVRLAANTINQASVAAGMLEGWTLTRDSNSEFTSRV